MFVFCLPPLSRMWFSSKQRCLLASAFPLSPFKTMSGHMVDAQKMYVERNTFVQPTIMHGALQKYLSIYIHPEMYVTPTFCHIPWRCKDLMVSSQRVRLLESSDWTHAVISVPSKISVRYYKGTKSYKFTRTKRTEDKMPIVERQQQTLFFFSTQKQLYGWGGRQQGCQSVMLNPTRDLGAEVLVVSKGRCKGWGRKEEN